MRKRLASFLPWASFVRSDVIAQKDGAFLVGFDVAPQHALFREETERMAGQALLARAIAKLGSGWAVWMECRRERAAIPPLSCNAKIPALDQFQKERRERFETKRPFVNCLTVWLCCYGQQRAASFGALAEGQNDQGAEDFERFLEQAAEFEGLLRASFGYVQRLASEALASALASSVEPVSVRRQVPQLAPIANYLTQSDLVVSPLHLGGHHVEVVTCHGLPAFTAPDVLDQISSLPFGYRWVTRWLALDRQHARSLIDRVQRTWAITKTKVISGRVDQQAVRMEADANEAEAALADPDTAFGLFSATVIVSDPDAAKARDKAHDILGVFNGAGIPARLETFGAVDAWFGTIPGDVRNGVTRPPITTTNFADLCPTTTPWKGETKRVLAEVRTTTGEAFNLSLHAGGSDVGHTAIIGPTGAGKSVLLSFIAAMKLREENARVIMVDHGGSARGVTEALGGTWHHLTEGSASFQPLRYADDMAALWLEDALSWSRVEVTQEVSEDVRRVIGLLAEEAPDDRRLDLARRLLARASWREALKALPAWFNGVERDRDNMLPIEAYELGGLMEHRAGSLVIEHMARMIERNLDGRPTLICFDEAWLALAGTALGRALEVWLRTLRKRNAAVIFATQAVADLTRSDLASVVLEQVPTRIFLPNVAASEPATRAAYESLGVNPATIRVIARSTPKQDYILQSPSSTAAVVLDLGPVGLELCTKQSARNSGVLCNAAA